MKMYDLNRLYNIKGGHIKLSNDYIINIKFEWFENCNISITLSDRNYENMVSFTYYKYEESLHGDEKLISTSRKKTIPDLPMTHEELRREVLELVKCLEVTQ